MTKFTRMKDASVEDKKVQKFYIGGPGYLQTFAQGDDLGDDDQTGDDDGGDDDETGDDAGDDDNETGFEYAKGSIDAIMGENKLDFNQILKDNPKLKSQFTDRFNASMSKRLKKYEGVDVDEYNDLKKRESSGKLEGDAQVWKDKHDKLKAEMETTTRAATIQQFAIEEKFDSEQVTFVTSMIDPSNLEKDDEGEWTGIEEEIERIKKKFPRMFPESDQQDEETDTKKKQKYNPGTKKTSASNKKLDPKARGLERAKERHKKRIK
ncbi:hypothetical protein BpsM61_00047 [Bacillus phage vB_BpsM-61]|nr:hypothetical protein BpsM61_00047 [Bacillus phage vB_BpsM-61]